MNRRDSILPIFLFVVIVVLVIGVTLIVIFKDEIFGTGKVLAKQAPLEQAKKGYGVYKKIYESPCISIDNKCVTAGLKYTTEYCVPHPETGNGCINENGEQTFASRSNQNVCQPNCRSFILQEVTTNENSICNYDEPYVEPAYNCVTANAKSFFYRNYTCVKNDSTGDNRCQYKCGSSGKDSAGINGDADPTKYSYIPACEANSGTTITLIALPWKNIYNLPLTGATTKGYTIKNLIVNNEVSRDLFQISPAYPPWSETPKSLISYDDLYLLDHQLTVYDNCTINPRYAKPLCDNYFFFNPDAPESDLTNNPKPNFCQIDSSFHRIAQCYYNPWYAPPTVIAGQTGLAFVNPYVTSPGVTGYTWSGIGNYGYISAPLSCLPNTNNLPPSNIPGKYKIPYGSTGGAICLNLTAPPQQCSNTFTQLVVNGVSPSNNLSSLIKQYDQNPNYQPPIIQSYPQVSGTTNYICRSEYPDGTVATDDFGNIVPGCVQTCQYMPNSSEIQFNALGPNGLPLDSIFQPLLGKYIDITYVDSSSGKYFLSVENTPCSGPGNVNTPLMNCLGTPPYNPVPCTYIYTGGTGLNAGTYWSKNGCDAQSITFASQMQLVISPQMTIPSVNPTITCDIYATVNGVFGYLSPKVNTQTNTIFGNLFNSGLNANIIANGILPGDIQLQFNPLPIGSPIPKSNPINEPYFVMTYDSLTKNYSIYPSQFPGQIYLNTFNGFTLTSHNILFSFTSEADSVPGQSYFTSRDYNEPYIKTEGVYLGKDVTRSINLQINNLCYNLQLCESLKDPNAICFPQSCNLFSEYNPESCSS